MATIYNNLSKLSGKIREEREKVSELLLVAEDNLNQLSMGIQADVDITDGVKLRYTGEELLVLFESENPPVTKKWADCPSDIQLNILFNFKPLLEKLESNANKLLSDMLTVQELAGEFGIESGNGKSDNKTAVEVLESVTKDLFPTKTEERNHVLELDGGKRELKPFRRFMKPTGPVPPLKDKKGQKEYGRKLLLWYYTHSPLETGITSISQLSNEYGILLSRLNNMKPYFREHFAYLFQNGKEPWMHVETEEALQKMFELKPEEQL